VLYQSRRVRCAGFLLDVERVIRCRVGYLCSRNDRLEIWSILRGSCAVYIELRCFAGAFPPIVDAIALHIVDLFWLRVEAAQGTDQSDFCGAD
jgi:hypothetical protein